MPIYRMAVELEGGWNVRPPWDFHNDTSVQLDVPCGIVGEISSPPYAERRNLFAWMRQAYPQFINQTCGLHIHISVQTPQEYSSLMCREFYNEFKLKYSEFAAKELSELQDGPDKQKHVTEINRLLERLSGTNRYCRDNWNPDIQTKLTGRQDRDWDHRYAMLNFCYSRHSTVESRVLPMFSDIDRAQRALEVFISLVEKYMAQLCECDRIEATSSEQVDDSDESSETIDMSRIDGPAQEAAEPPRRKRFDETIIEEIIRRGW